MEPLKTVEYAMRFAAALSAWWLLLALPLVALLVLALYHRQSRAIERGHAWGLTAFRVVIMAIVVLLAFRPSLIRRVTMTYPGRLLVLLDDSASMGIHDPALPESEALTIARQTQDRLTGREAPLAELRQDVLTLERMLIRFERSSRGADRSLDTFWSKADTVQAQVDERLKNVAQRAADLANSTDATNSLNVIATRCRDLQTALKPLFSGEQPPGADFAVKMRASLAELAALLGAAQAAADHVAIEGGAKALTDAVEAVRRAPRLDLTYAWLQRHRDALTDAAEGLSLWLLPLSQKKPTLFSALGPKVPAISGVETDLSGALLSRLEEDNPFPLAGILVFSDGRNLGATPYEAVTRAATLRSVPIYCAAVGGPAEPPDLAVREVHYPPFAVVGKPVNVRTELKTILPKPEKVDFALVGAKKNVITNETLEIDDQAALRRWLVTTPAAEGLQRLTVRMGSAGSEVAPRENNQMDLSIRVRTEPVRVLFLDWKPRWQSRFVLNILSRLDYLDVNSIIVLAQPKGTLKRGVGKSFWPEDAGALALYDLVIVGELPRDVLTQEEWRRLADYVEAGGSLAMLGGGRQDPLPPAVLDLLPTQPRAAATVPPADTQPLYLTPAGHHHPVTRSLAGVFQVADSVVGERRRNETIGLLQSGDGHPLISTRFRGKGKTILVDTDRLWRRLNAASLDAHSALVAGLADWAVEGRKPANRHPEPDLYRYTSRESVQVWVESAGLTNPVVELRSGEQMLESSAAPAHTGATWSAAVFETVPPGDWTMSLRGGASAPEPLCVVNRSRELNDLSRDEASLRATAVNAGGAYAAFTDAGRLLNDIQPRSRVERHERVWRLWDSGWILTLVIVMLTIEWVWRKLAGLV